MGISSALAVVQNVWDRWGAGDLTERWRFANLIAS